MRTLDGLPDFPFTVEARDGRARAGLLETPRGLVRTPCFMPVGTKGTVKRHFAGETAGYRSPGHPCQYLSSGATAWQRCGAQRAAPLHAMERPLVDGQWGLSRSSVCDTARIWRAVDSTLSMTDQALLQSRARAMAEQAALGPI